MSEDCRGMLRPKPDSPTKLRRTQQDRRWGLGGGGESEAPPRQLTAKERKALAAKERQRAERLQAEIYGRVDVEGYLRGNGADNAI